MGRTFVSKRVSFAHLLSERDISLQSSETFVHEDVLMYYTLILIF